VDQRHLKTFFFYKKKNIHTARRGGGGPEIAQIIKNNRYSNNFEIPTIHAMFNSKKQLNSETNIFPVEKSNSCSVVGSCKHYKYNKTDAAE
jgi:hypothetical protein